MERFRFVIITGMSGAGKTNFMQKLEDMGYYCVDNLPPVLIARFADLCWKSTSNTRHVAVVSWKHRTKLLCGGIWKPVGSTLWPKRCAFRKA